MIVVRKEVATTALLPALTHLAGEHPLLTPPATGCISRVEFFDSRSNLRKRLLNLMCDLDYVIEAPGAAIRLLFVAHQVSRSSDLACQRTRGTICWRYVQSGISLRTAQGMEYEQNRWLEAFGFESQLCWNPSCAGGKSSE